MKATAAHHLDGDDRWAISVTEMARRLDISRAHAYRLVASGEIPSVRLGHRTVVAVRAIDEMLAGASDRWPAPPVRAQALPVDTSGASASGHLVRRPEDSLGVGDEAGGGAKC